MKTKVSIRGTICSAAYDCGWFGSWIDKGIITPMNRAVSAIAAVQSGEMELYISSPGGDCFAGAEILVALSEAVARGVKVSVTVGAEACSMAANIVAAMKAVGCKVTVHPNSQIMFHSCYSGMCGGPEAHQDEADILGKINAAVKKNLEKIGIVDTDEWFAEGRMKWIDSDEAVKIGLADEIFGEAAEDVMGGKDVASRLAAFVGDLKAPTEEMVPMARLAGLQKTKDQEIAALQSKIAEMSALDAVKLAADLEAAKAEAVQLKADADAAKAQIADFESKHKAATDALAEANAKVEQLTSDLGTTKEALASSEANLAEAREHLSAWESHASEHGATVNTPPDGKAKFANFAAAVDALGYAKAAREYPELKASYRVKK